MRFFVTSWENNSSNCHPDNPHLTTFTQHVMVGITRSKVIQFYIDLVYFGALFRNEALTVQEFGFKKASFHWPTLIVMFEVGSFICHKFVFRVCMIDLLSE